MPAIRQSPRPTGRRRRSMSSPARSSASSAGLAAAGVARGAADDNPAHHLLVHLATVEERKEEALLCNTPFHPSPFGWLRNRGILMFCWWRVETLLGDFGWFLQFWSRRLWLSLIRQWGRWMKIAGCLLVPALGSTFSLDQVKDSTLKQINGLSWWYVSGLVNYHRLVEFSFES